MEERRPQPGERYRHLKGELCQIVAVAVYSETQEELVIYQELYGDFRICAKELNQFLGEADPEKYPDMQKDSDIQKKQRLEKEEQTKKAVGFEKFEKKEENVPLDKTKILLEFLDCDSYEKKLEYLRGNKKYIDDGMLNNISFALDIVIEEGELEDRIRTLENCLKTFCRYEGTRLR